MHKNKVTMNIQWIVFCVVVFGSVLKICESGTLKRNTSCSEQQYYDKKERECLDFPGGGKAIFVDYSARCLDDYLGLKKHPTQKSYYYYCKPDSIIIGKCHDTKVFDRKKKECVCRTNGTPKTIKVYDESNSAYKVPRCTQSGRFPVSAAMSYFYSCEYALDKFLQKILRCPGESRFDSRHSKCNDFDENYPPCQMAGRFRSPKTCSKYFVCQQVDKNSFAQMRYKCPHRYLYDTATEKCIKSNLVSCQPKTMWDIMSDYKKLHNKRNRCPSWEYYSEEYNESEYIMPCEDNDNNDAKENEEEYDYNSKSSKELNEEEHKKEEQKEEEQNEDEIEIPDLSGNESAIDEDEFPTDDGPHPTLSFDEAIAIIFENSTIHPKYTETTTIPLNSSREYKEDEIEIPDLSGNESAIDEDEFPTDDGPHPELSFDEAIAIIFENSTIHPKYTETTTIPLYSSREYKEDEIEIPDLSGNESAIDEDEFPTDDGPHPELSFDEAIAVIFENSTSHPKYTETTPIPLNSSSEYEEYDFLRFGKISTENPFIDSTENSSTTDISLSMNNNYFNDTNSNENDESSLGQGGNFGRQKFTTITPTYNLLNDTSSENTTTVKSSEKKLVLEDSYGSTTSSPPSSDKELKPVKEDSYGSATAARPIDKDSANLPAKEDSYGSTTSLPPSSSEELKRVKEDSYGSTTAAPQVGKEANLPVKEESYGSTTSVPPSSGKELKPVKEDSYGSTTEARPIDKDSASLPAKEDSYGSTTSLPPSSRKELKRVKEDSYGSTTAALQVGKEANLPVKEESYGSTTSSSPSSGKDLKPVKEDSYGSTTAARPIDKYSASLPAKEDSYGSTTSLPPSSRKELIRVKEDSYGSTTVKEDSYSSTTTAPQVGKEANLPVKEESYGSTTSSPPSSGRQLKPVKEDSYGSTTAARPIDKDSASLPAKEDSYGSTTSLPPSSREELKRVKEDSYGSTTAAPQVGEEASLPVKEESYGSTTSSHPSSGKELKPVKEDSYGSTTTARSVDKDSASLLVKEESYGTTNASPPFENVSEPFKEDSYSSTTNARPVVKELASLALKEESYGSTTESAPSSKSPLKKDEYSTIASPTAGIDNTSVTEESNENTSTVHRPTRPNQFTTEKPLNGSFETRINNDGSYESQTVEEPIDFSIPDNLSITETTTSITSSDVSSETVSSSSTSLKPQTKLFHVVRHPKNSTLELFLKRPFKVLINYDTKHICSNQGHDLEDHHSEESGNQSSDKDDAYVRVAHV